MHGHRAASSLTLALLAATFLTPPDLVRAAPGDALGGEFQVNTVTLGDQRVVSVAMAPDGDFVVAWDTDVDGGIIAQRFNAEGAPQGPEIQVNALTPDNRVGVPAVAMDADGDFVVAWFSTRDDYYNDIFARRFNAAGVAQGPDFQVNADTWWNQIEPVVAMDADGDFIVAWTSEGGSPYGPLGGIFARRYDAAGIAHGPEFLVEATTTTNLASSPAVAMDADGDFVVVWHSRPDTGTVDFEVFAQRYDAAGASQGSEFQVNSVHSGAQSRPAVAMDADGDFVVTWRSCVDGPPCVVQNVFARRYDAAGAARGPEFKVHSATTGAHGEPAIAMDADGDFVVAWQSYPMDGDSLGISARRFDAAGVAQGPDFQVNSYTTERQQTPVVAMDADGDFVVAWESWGQDGSIYGIFAQRYDGAERVEGDFDGDGNADLLWRNTTTGNAIVWLMEGTERRAAGSIGTVPVEWEVAGTGDFNGDGKADILWRHGETGSTVIWQMDGLTKTASAAIGKPPPDWVVEQLRDTDGDGNADIFWRNSASGGTLVWRMSGFTKTVVGSPGAAGAEWQVQ